MASNFPIRGVYRDGAGDAVASPTVTVYEASTSTPATIYSDRAGTPLANPFTGDADGEWEFYAEAGQSVKVRVEKTGYTAWEKDWIEVGYDFGDVLVIDEANSRVGVGTPSPATEFHVSFSNSLVEATVESTLAGGIPLLALKGVTQEWRFQNQESGAQQLYIRDVTNSKFPFTIESGAPTSSFYIDSSGRVGIGTASPVEELEVVASDETTVLVTSSGVSSKANIGIQNNSQRWDWRITGADDLWLNDVTTGGGRSPIQVQAAAPTRALRITTSETILNDNGADQDLRVEGLTEPNLLFVDAGNGRVGIGTAAPTEALDVRGNVFIKGSLANGRLDLETNDGTQKWRFQSTQSSGAFIFRDATASTSPFSIAAGAPSNALSIDSGGRVGMGVSAPNNSAILELSSTTGALLLPRMTTTQRNALTATNGMVIYNTTTGQIEGYTSGSWSAL